MCFCSSKSLFLFSIQTLSTPRQFHILRQMPTFSRDPDSDMEIVEDSEPERVRIRSQGRKSASNAREPQINISASRMHQCSNIDSHTTATVIEISGMSLKSLNFCPNLRLSRLRILYLVLWPEFDHTWISFYSRSTRYATLQVVAA